MIQSQPLLTNEDEYVPYNVESSFTNVPIKNTIDFNLDEIYLHNKLPVVCTRLIMERLKAEQRSFSSTLELFLSVTIPNVHWLSISSGIVAGVIEMHSHHFALMICIM